MRPLVYLVGSLRNSVVVDVTNALDAAQCDVFSDWFTPGPEADDYWQRYEKARGRTYRQALTSPAAQNTFAFDLRNLLKADVVVMVAPAGKSAHLELGFAAGCGKPTFILMDEPSKKDRWDVMTLFAGEPIDADEVLADASWHRTPGIAYHVTELIEMINDHFARVAMDDVPDKPNPERVM